MDIKKLLSRKSKKYKILLSLITVVPLFIISYYDMFNLVGFMIVFIPHTVFNIIWDKYIDADMRKKIILSICVDANPNYQLR